MAAIAQYVTIVDKSNKVVGTSKQLRNVFKEAKLAYHERKAEILAEKKRKEDTQSQQLGRTTSQGDGESRRGGPERRGTRRGSRRHSARPDESETRSSRTHIRAPPSIDPNAPFSDRSRSNSVSPISPRFADPPTPPNDHTVPPHFNEDTFAPPLQKSLSRRRTEDLVVRSARPVAVRSNSLPDSDVDLDLAYGECHPSSLTATKDGQQKELSSLVLRCKGLLDEANCAQHSAKAIIAHLQRNPDAMAAVALTLAEISNVVSKMAPGALAAVAKTSPAVMALLVSPQFLVAVGVGVGVTVVAFGGYKIIKKIKERSAKDAREAGADEMLDVRELDRIEMWRRGISEEGQLSRSVNGDEARSIASGTSVDGEFISPYAEASMGHLPIPARERSKHKKKKRHSTDATSENSSVTSRKSSTHSERKDRALVKVPKPSPLRRMLTSASSHK